MSNQRQDVSNDPYKTDFVDRNGQVLVSSSGSVQGEEASSGGNWVIALPADAVDSRTWRLTQLRDHLGRHPL
jgi:hypothetical protein